MLSPEFQRDILHALLLLAVEASHLVCSANGLGGMSLWDMGDGCWGPGLCERVAMMLDSCYWKLILVSFLLC